MLGLRALSGSCGWLQGAFAAVSDCFDYSTMNPVVALCDPGFDSSEVVLDGNIAYVLRDYPAGLSILDISEPTTPREIGSLSNPELNYNLRRDGDRLYATSYHGLSVIDVSEPTSPVVLGFLALSDIYDIATADNLVYIAQGWQTFRIVDVSNPAQPVVVGEIQFPNRYVESVAVAGTLAYVGVRDFGMFVVDVSDPSAPQLIPQLFVAYCANQIEVQDGLVWIGDDAHGALTAWDLNEPAGPPDAPRPMDRCRALFSFRDRRRSRVHLRSRCRIARY